MILSTILSSRTSHTRTRDEFFFLYTSFDSQATTGSISAQSFGGSSSWTAFTRIVRILDAESRGVIFETSVSFPCESTLPVCPIHTYTCRCCQMDTHIHIHHRERDNFSAFFFSDPCICTHAYADLDQDQDRQYARTYVCVCKRERERT